MSLPGVESVLPSWKVGVVTASPPSRTNIFFVVYLCFVLSILTVTNFNKTRIFFITNHDSTTNTRSFPKVNLKLGPLSFDGKCFLPVFENVSDKL